ncbi:putative D,D-dipeptide-binding periplasmic protein DdpA [subsurface metagenome]
MKKILKLLGAVIILSFLLTVCVPVAATAEIKTLVVAIEGDVETLDPNFSRFPTANMANLNVYDQFFRYGIDDTGKGYSVTNVAKIEGAAIESWEIADDRMSVLLHVRKGVKFPMTGNPMTADDIIWWYKKGLDTKSGNLWNIETSNISSMTKKGDYDVLVKFSKPLNLFFMLARDQSWGVVDSVEVMKHATANDPWGNNWLAKNYAGAGEFIVESWDPGVQMVLKANRDYWAGKPYFDRVILKIIPNSSNRALLLKQGEVDVAFGLSSDQIDSIQDEKGINVMSIPSRTQVTVILNNSVPPLNNKKVRQALTYLVPYKSIIDDIYKGRALQQKDTLAVLAAGYNPEFWKYETNVDKAKELLAEAGIPDGFEFTLNIKQGEEISSILAITLQAAFKKAGVMMNIREVTNAIWAEEMSTGACEATLWAVGYLMYINDPWYSISGSFGCNRPTNHSLYCNPHIDELLEELEVVLDPVERKKLLDEVLQILDDDAPHLWLADIPVEYCLNSNLNGFVFLEDSLFWFYPLQRAE